MWHPNSNPENPQFGKWAIPGGVLTKRGIEEMRGNGAELRARCVACPSRA